jgi:hypothetical protein
MKKSITLIAVLILLSGERAAAQDVPDPSFTLAKKSILSASFQYQNLPNRWDINYYGLNLEIFLNEHVSYSGSLCFGKGSDNLYYGHFPLAGTVLLLPVFLAMAGIEGMFPGFFENVDTAGDWTKAFLKILLLENLNYNLRIGKKFIITPYLNLLGAEGEAHEEGKGSETSDVIILTTGAGINSKIFLTSRFTLSPNLNVKRYFTWGRASFGDGNYNGYAFGINLGYVF